MGTYVSVCGTIGPFKRGKIRRVLLRTSPKSDLNYPVQTAHLA